MRPWWENAAVPPKVASFLNGLVFTHHGYPQGPQIHPHLQIVLYGDQCWYSDVIFAPEETGSHNVTAQHLSSDCLDKVSRLVGIMISDSASSGRTASSIAPPEGPKEGPTKKRASKACQNCRARKVKCNIIDNGIPCAYCCRRNVACAVSKSNRGRYDLSKQVDIEEQLLMHAELQEEI